MKWPVRVVLWWVVTVGCGVWTVEGDSSSDSADQPLLSSCTTGAGGVLECVGGAVGEVWSVEKVRAGAELRRAVRAAGREARGITSLVAPFLSSSSTVLTQVLSFMPGAVNAVVSAVSSLVYAAGTGVRAAGSGLGYGGRVVEILGNGISDVSNQVPTVVTLVLMGGLAMFTLFPHLQNSVFNTLASAGLAVVGKVANQVRGLVEDDTLWATLLDTLHLFTIRTREDLYF
ncbi:hypothetical protein Pcinc_016073 [Petrolisthes cinctipes]|uniref:Uncharacterized protein n=1 Tax=Petrolisthes cinctipes TaxID=88211 RepID=A0AAE1KP38_PETCI|nr:hypothetical protein Pcinc_016073 [Petrolisthes cinctipes]